MATGDERSARIQSLSFRAEQADFFFRVRSSNASACGVEVLFGIARILRDESLLDVN